MSKQRIMLLGAKERFAPAILKAKEFGLTTIVLDGNVFAKALSLADIAVVVDISQAEKVLDVAVSQNIQGIVSLSEFGVRSAALVVEHLHLPGNNVGTSERATNKYLQRLFWNRAGLSQPSFHLVKTLQELHAAANTLGFPCVVKPLTSGASRGISIVPKQEDLSVAFSRVQEYSNDGSFIVEQFIEGTELSCEALTVGSQTFVLAIGDREIERREVSPIARSINYPANISPHVSEGVQRLVSEAVKCLEISGPSHTEVIVDKCGTPRLLEMAARGGGGNIWMDIVELVSGVDYVGSSIKLAMGESVEIKQIEEKGACYRFFFPKHGIIQDIVGIPEAKKLVGVRDIGFIVKPGDRIGPLTSGAHRAGWIVTMGQTRDDAYRIADKVEAKIKFVMEEDGH